MSIRISQVLLIAIMVTLGALWWQLGSRIQCSYRFTNPRGAEEVEDLITELRDPSACIRSAAAFDLQKTGLHGATASPLLVSLLIDPADFVRWRAAAALGHIGIATPDAIRGLIRALQDPNPNVRFNATYSIGLLAAPEAGQPLAALATDPNPGVRHNALYTLRFVALASDHDWLCPILAKALHSGTDGWLAAAETAGMIGCTDLLPDITNVRAEWDTRCPSTPSAKNSPSSTYKTPWALSPDIGRGCESEAKTLAILDKTLRMLAARKTLAGW
jgi:hypothetical protein